MTQLPSLPQIQLNDFFFELPEEKIATQPRADRTQSKLLVYAGKNINHDIFRNINHYLPENTVLFFNNTRVIPARIFFYKSSGSIIEVFLLQPETPSTSMQDAMAATETCRWSCMIGNLKKWKIGTELIKNINVDGVAVRLSAMLLDRDSKSVEFKWDNPHIPFARLIHAAGEIPLPPYIKRKANEADKPGYQTVYGTQEGAVAAPTAGLHFSKELIQEIENRKIKCEYLTLHVSAGTFQPIKDKNIIDHPMHSEQMCVSKSNLTALLQNKIFPIAVGTTSMRTLESTYWYGVKLIKSKDTHFNIEKLYPYQWLKNQLPTMHESFSAIIEYMEAQKLETIYGSTEIFIFPGYEFQVCKGLITNYHLPGSTLILLVAAFVGNDWRKIYDEALQNNYSFLSYGDASFLIRQ